MKKSLLITAGLALAAAAIYWWRSRKTVTQNHFPEHENERHHLTDVFSKAKKVALGN